MRTGDRTRSLFREDELKMMHKSDMKTGGKTSALRVAVLASVCAIALATTAAMPVALDDHGLTIKSAFAGNGNGNGGGNGNSGGNGKDSAPGQEKKLADDESAAEEDAATSIAEGIAAENGEFEQPAILPIAEDAEPANNKVIKELAGLPEESALSEEEELEAIRSGWGTWRTADGPETVIAQ
ncbi:MAG: hypothetical protein ABFS30_07160 [Pseudomonadota bacterium]